MLQYVVCPSVCLSDSVCLSVVCPSRYRDRLEYFENNVTVDWFKHCARADRNMGDLVQREHPQN